MPAVLDSSMDKNKRWGRLSHFPKRRGKCQKQAVEFEGSHESPGSNDVRRRSKWNNHCGRRHLRDDEMHTLQWRKKNK